MPSVINILFQKDKSLTCVGSSSVPAVATKAFMFYLFIFIW